MNIVVETRNAVGAVYYMFLFTAHETNSIFNYDRK